ncbi:MAG: helix-turn-helix domain-containing protein [Desulfobacteraceae bacterium]
MAPLIDKDIGIKIKVLRESQGVTQIELAGKIGVSFQQVQKYEKGATRIAVSRLQEIAGALGVDIRYFFEEATVGPEILDPQLPYASAGTGYGGAPTVLSAEERSLLRLFRKIRNKKIREGILKQLKGVLEVQKAGLDP